MARDSEPENRLGFGKKLAFAAASLLVFLILAEAIMQAAGVAASRARKQELKPGARVIVCVGDSHTYGVFVRKQETYPAQLEKLLNQNGANYEVINLGAPGQNTTQILNALPGIIRTYHPYALILLVGLNNYWNTAGQNNDPALQALNQLKLYKLGRLLYYQRIHKKQEFMVAQRRDSDEILLHQSRPIEPKTDKEVQKVYMRLSDELIKIVNYCMNNRVKVIMAGYAGERKDDYLVYNKINELVAKANNIPFADNNAYFVAKLTRPDGTIDQSLQDQIFFPDMHLKPKGYSWFAQNLFDLMKKQGVVE